MHQLFYALGVTKSPSGRCELSLLDARRLCPYLDDYLSMDGTLTRIGRDAETYTGGAVTAVSIEALSSKVHTLAGASEAEGQENIERKLANIVHQYAQRDKNDTK